MQGEQLKAFVGVTDNEWFAFLSVLPHIDEVNFQQAERHNTFQRGRRSDPMSFQMDLA